MVNKLNRLLIKAETELKEANDMIPEGYQMAANTLPKRIKLMVEGLHTFAEDRRELQEEVWRLERELADKN